MTNVTDNADTPNKDDVPSQPQAPPNPFAKIMEVDKDGLTFANKTAQWIAYERDIESQRSDCLFHDPLAKHLTGKYGKTLSDLFGKYASNAHFFPGLGEQGFILYHGARTKLISDHLMEWAKSVSTGGKQVLNLGAGYDTRAFWDTSLGDVDLYIEVDEMRVNTPKEKILQELESLPKLICPRRCISLNFETETIQDLPKYDFNSSIPTCWVLEGLIMYLEKDAVRNIYENIAELSVPESYAIINFIGNSKEHHQVEFADSILLGKGWIQVKKVLFGETDFRYGRYPKDVESNKNLGFVFYRKIKI
eukprot:GSMAST32.ASY1.ANO1.2016.1 assembled CDS